MDADAAGLGGSSSNAMADQVGPEYYDSVGVSVVLRAPDAEPVKADTVEDRRIRHTILALPTPQGWIYPTWQFRDQEIVSGLSEVLAAFHLPDTGRDAPADGSALGGDVVTRRRSKTCAEPWSPWSVAVWMTTPLLQLGDVSVAAWLLEGREHDRVLQLARRTAAAWAA